MKDYPNYLKFLNNLNNDSKATGWGKTYANTGTCANVASYLQHEDVDRMKDGKEPEPFSANGMTGLALMNLYPR